MKNTFETKQQVEECSGGMLSETNEVFIVIRGVLTQAIYVESTKIIKRQGHDVEATEKALKTIIGKKGSTTKIISLAKKIFFNIDKEYAKDMSLELYKRFEYV
jgi:hypothetical protein